MPLQLFSNNAVSLLNAPISAIATSLTVMNGHGAMFPTPTLPGEFFLITLENQSATLREIIKVTARVGDTFTIERAQEGTIARAWSASSGNDTLVDHRVTAETMRQAFLQPVASSTPSSASIYDCAFTISYGSGTTILQLGTPYVTETARVFVGGLRLKRDVDFEETAPTTITIFSTISQVDIDAGSNIVVDIDPA